MKISNVFIFGSNLTNYLSSSNGWFEIYTNLYAIPYGLWNYLAITPSWTLPLEMTFYILAPFVVKSNLRLAALFFLSAIVKYSLIFHFGYIDPWTYRFFSSEIMYFSAGALSYRLLPLARRSNPLIGHSMLIVCSVIIVFWAYLPIGDWFYLLLTLSVPFILASGSSRIDIKLGDASYLLYLVHAPIIFALGAIFKSPSIWVVLPTVLLVAFLATPIAETVEMLMKRRLRARGKWRAD